MNKTEKVSIYRDVQDTEGKQVSLSAVLMGIKQGKWKGEIDELRAIQDEKKQKAYKNTLPCVTCSGVFKTRNGEELIARTNVLTMDIDLKDNPVLLEKFDEIRKTLIEDKYTSFLFTSCRGNGFAVGAKIDRKIYIVVL